MAWPGLAYADGERREDVITCDHTVTPLGQSIKGQYSFNVDKYVFSWQFVGRFYRLKFLLLDNICNCFGESEPILYQVTEGEDVAHQVLNLPEKIHRKIFFYLKTNDDYV